jgi:hypothetical protein
MYTHLDTVIGGLYFHAVSLSAQLVLNHITAVPPLSFFYLLRRIF